MSTIEDNGSLIYIKPFTEAAVAQMNSENIWQLITTSISTKSCEGVTSTECRDDSAAFTLKMIALGAILISGIAGVSIPLIGKDRRFLRTDSNLFFAAKAFSAGVILATGFVHMLPSGTSALTDTCLPKSPWSKFPFSGFVAMMAALATLVADFVGTQFYEKKEEERRVGSGIVSDSVIESVSRTGSVVGDETDGMHIVGIHAHAAQHRHNSMHGKQMGEEHLHGHSHGFGDDEDDEVEGSARHVVVSQILELGIVSHSVLIGLALGVSHSPCTIRPLIAALSFHQFFEGFALGGCISQALLKKVSTIIMACFFAITTPAGIGIGAGIASLYNPNSPRALVVEGILDSISAGILVYMALVDLIAADFLSKRMRCNLRLQIVSYFALFLGAGSMSLLAIWA